MYNKIECVCISCDNCNEDYQSLSTGFSIFIDEDAAHDSIDSHGDWYIDEGKHYCPACHIINEEDELVIKPKKDTA